MGQRKYHPPPKKSCLDNTRNAIARTAAQIRTGHWRSAVYLKRIRKMAEDKCWFCQTSARMARSHVFLHCPNARLRAAREEAWEGKTPRGVRVLLANSRWERRMARFLELSWVGRVMADGWSVCRENGRVGGMGDGGRDRSKGRGLTCFVLRFPWFAFIFPILTLL
jgi:hypothetical protein